VAAAPDVSAIPRAIARIGADLGHREWALIGGLAVSARAEPRTTRDVDIAVAVRDDADAEALVATLLRQGYTMEGAVEQVETGRLATVRLLPPGATSTSAIVDLLFASSGIEDEVVSGATVLDILPDLSVPVASTGHLIALKLLSRDDDRRPQDAVDLRALLREASPTDIAEARSAVAAIAARGYHRGRDLGALLDEALCRFTSTEPSAGADD
jgi:predicted nucleotidyltransferase